MTKWYRTFGIMALITVLPLSTASSVLAAQAPRTEDLASLGAADSNEDQSAGLSVEAHTAERTESGSLLSITWSVENNGNSEVFVDWLTGNSYMYSMTSYFSGVTAASSSGSNRYHPVMDGESDCLCSGKLSIDFKENIKPGEQVAYWSMYSVPEDVDAITLEIPGFEPIEDIPIS